MIAVLKHELLNYTHMFISYIYCTFMLIFVGIGSMLYNIQAAVANFEYVLSFVCIGLTVIIPVLTMRSISEDKKQKTDQLLFSLPLKTSMIVLGKYVALIIVFAVPLVVIGFYPLVFSMFGDVYLPTSYGSLLAFFLMGAALVAVGIFISSLTENQGIAAGIGIPVFLLNYYCVTLSEYVSSSALGSFIILGIFAILLALLIRYLTKLDTLSFGVGIVIILAMGIVYLINNSLFEGLVPNIMEQISLFDRFYDFVDGVFDITSIVFYLTVIAFFLFLTVQSLEKRRYN